METSASHVSEFERLRFFRDEVKHEFNLLAMRSTILVTCQSFLVVPFAILCTASRFRAVLVPIYLVSLLGLFIVLILRGPINAAHRTINKWLINQRALMKDSEALKEVAIDRDLLPDVDADIRRDRDHIKSLAFSRYGPAAFALFWLAAAVWSTARAIIGF